MIPQDPAYEAKVRESFGRQNHMTTLGAAIEFLAPGEVHLSLPFAPRFCQQNGFMHAGAIASVADSANGYAAYSLAPPETDVLAVEFKINLLAPALAESFLACGRVLRAGRTLTVCQAEVFTAGRDDADAGGRHALHAHRAPDGRLALEAHPLGSETPMGMDGRQCADYGLDAPAAACEGSVVGRGLLAVVTFGALRPGVLRGRRAEVSVRTAEIGGAS